VVNASPKAVVDLLWSWGKAQWQSFAPDIEGTRLCIVLLLLLLVLVLVLVLFD